MRKLWSIAMSARCRSAMIAGLSALAFCHLAPIGAAEPTCAGFAPDAAAPEASVNDGSALEAAADQLTAWARHGHGAQQDQAERNAAFERRLEALIIGAVALLDQPRDEALLAWESANVLEALIEARVAAQVEERLMLANAAQELASCAPTDQARASLVRFEIRMLESHLMARPVQHADGAAAVDDNEYESIDEIADPRWLRLMGYLERGDHLLTEQAPGSGSTGPHDEIPGTETGATFEAHLRSRLATLRVGQPAPRFLARDTAGNEVRSTFLPGKVHVLRFWSSDVPASVIAHQEDARLVRRFWNASFELMGATRDSDREAHLDFLLDRGLRGTQIFDGPISTALFDALSKASSQLAHGAGLHEPVGIWHAWNHPAPGSLFVIDDKGIIRGRDLDPTEVIDLVDSLVEAKRIAHREYRERRLTASSSR